MDHQSRARLIDLTVLIAIMLVGFALRAHRLDGQDLWGDEAASLSIVLDTWGEVFSPARETHPPLHRALYKPWVDAVGQKPLFALRYAPLVVGVLLIPLTFHLGRQLFGRRVGMLAALLVAVGPLHVYYAQEFRTYSLFTVLAVGTVSAFVVLTRRGAHCKRAWAVYLAVTLAAIYTHYLAFWLIVAQNAVALLSGAWAGRRWRWLGGQALLALSYLPWIMAQAPFLLGQGGRRALTWTAADAWEIARRGALSWTVGLTPGDSMALAAALTLGAVALAGVGLAVAASPPERWRAGLLGGCVGFTLLMGWAVNPAMPFFHERFLIGAAPVFTVLVVAGVARFKAGWHVMLLAVLVLGALAADHQWYTNPAYQKSGYGGAMRAVAARAMPGDCILLSNGHQMALFDYYRPPGIEAALTDPAALADPERVDPHLQGLVGDAERVWLIEYGDPIGYDRQRRAPAWLAERGFRQSFFSFLGGTVSLYVMGEAEAEWQPIEARFGDLVGLTGYAVTPADPRPGDVLRITLRWEALAPIPAHYTVTNQLLDAEGRLVAQTDGEPAGGARPTDGWRVGEAIVDRHAIELPGDLSPGAYTLQVGLYPWPDLTRLPVGDGDALRLETVLVQSPDL